ncbi:MAG: hypothetical protein HY735_01725 [Verrucomicrobia bacterium]|nr:hypothetical protein [Verrucomicrobiota bacterium]
MAIKDLFHMFRDRGKAARTKRTLRFAPAGFFHSRLDVIQHSGLACETHLLLDFFQRVVEAVADLPGRRGLLDADPHVQVGFA